MQDTERGLRRTPLPRTPVNRVESEGRRVIVPAFGFEYAPREPTHQLVVIVRRRGDWPTSGAPATVWGMLPTRSRLALDLEILGLRPGGLAMVHCRMRAPSAAWSAARR